MQKVVYIDIDSLRPDHIAAYGYPKETTPYIDNLADDGVRFSNAYVSNSPCMPSRAAFLTGRYGADNGIETHGRLGQQLNTPAADVECAGTWRDSQPDRPWWTLSELFFQNGIHTAGVSSFPRHPALWFHRLWDEFHQPREPVGTDESFQTVRGESVVNRAVDLLKPDSEQFLYVQLWDPHGPYNRSEEQIEPFRDGLEHTYPTDEQITGHREWSAWRSATHMGISDRSDLAELVAQYDAEIHYADRQIGRLTQELKDLGCYDETMIVVTGDHGEEFGEHGLYREHWSTHDGTQRVPLIIKPPGDLDVEPGVRDHLVTNVDMAPTIADAAGFEPPTRWQGRSLVPVLRNTDVAGRDEIIFDHGLYTAQRAVRTDRWKLIITLNPGMWRGVVPDIQLFDMYNDPWEQHNIASEYPDIVSGLKQSVSEWESEYISDYEDALEMVAESDPSGYSEFASDFDGV